MLIVVAIVGILVAVAVPVLMNSREKARTSVCLANRRSLKTAVAVTAMNDGRSDYSAIMESILQSNADTYRCPSGGHFTWVDEEGSKAGHVECSVHKDEDDGSDGTRAFSNLSNSPDFARDMAYFMQDLLKSDDLGFKTWASVYDEGGPNQMDIYGIGYANGQYVSLIDAALDKYNYPQEVKDAVHSNTTVYAYYDKNENLLAWSYSDDWGHTKYIYFPDGSSTTEKGIGWNEIINIVGGHCTK